jgi:hypothetical protein
MIHRTFRSLDEAPRLLAFTIKQWAALIVGGSAVFGVIHLAQVPTKPAITLFVFLVGLPAALAYVSESGGLQLGLLVRDMVRWRFSRQALPAASAEHRRARGVLLGAGDEESGSHLRRVADDPRLNDLLSGERWGR